MPTKGIVLVALLAAGCGRIGFDPLTGDGGLSSDGDGVLDDASTAPISPFAPFTSVRPIDELRSAGEFLDHPTLSPDMLTRYLTKETATSASIWQTGRDSLSNPWSPIVLVPELNSASSDNAPNLSLDGLVMHFTSTRGGPTEDLYIANRALEVDPWGNITRISELSTIEFEHSPTLTPDSLRMVFDREGELHETTRATKADSWSPPVPIAELNRPGSYVGDAVLADGGLTLCFDSEFTATELDFYVATRPSLDAPFETPVPIDSLNTSAIESDPWLSPDGHTMFFSRSVSLTAAEIFVATR